MQPETAAKIFYDWAYREGFIQDKPAPEQQSPDADIALIVPKTDAGISLLRSKQVEAVAFDASNQKLWVFTKRVAPKSKRQLALLPNRVDDVVIEYRQGVQEPIGPIPSTPQGGPAYVRRQAAGTERYTCGSSISVGNFRDAGTLGCLVRDAGGILYGLTNNHVSGGSNFAGVGLPIVAPGIFDVVPNGLNPFTIGHHARSLTMIPGSADNIDPKANFDAAIFRIDSEDLVTSFQRDQFDTPAASIALSPNMSVEKVGRTTGLTRGKVVGQIFGAHPIRYSNDLYGFTGHVFFEPVFAIVGLTDVFSDNGDSGSLIVAVDQNGQRNAVGIVVGGMNDGSAPGGKTTIALPIQPILAGLGVTLVTGHNV
ncbi:MAG: hypothetical protein E5X77_10075 [Mesorhizobium sp.]|nr:MAG: hypothetical protein E5X77_10075 [Mesorhizobium sp.]